MKTPKRPACAAKALQALQDDFKAARIDATALGGRRRLSKQTVLKHLKPFGFDSASSVLSHPATHQAYRALKFAVEGITVPADAIATVFADLIDQVRTCLRTHPQVTSVSGIFRVDHALYKRLCLDPHATFIGWAAGLPRERRDFLYWTDEQLLQQAAGCDSLTALKIKGGELHRHLMGRELMNALIRLQPHLAGEFKIGQLGHRYRSKPELVLGNWLALNEVAVSREFDTGLYRSGSTRPLVADFKLLPDGPLIEVLQNEDEGRGSRGETYGKRWEVKHEIYTKAGVWFESIPTDDLYDHGVLDVAALVERIRSVLDAAGVDIGAPPPLEALIHEDCHIKRELMGRDLPGVVGYLRELGAHNTRVLRNNFSWALTCLRVRADYEQILAIFKTEGYRSRGVAVSARRAASRQKYAPLSEVRRLCRERGIRGQSAWRAFARTHRTVLRERRIPSNLPHIYKQLGSWISWGDVWPREGEV